MGWKIQNKKGNEKDKKGEMCRRAGRGQGRREGGGSEREKRERLEGERSLRWLKCIGDEGTMLRREGAGEWGAKGRGEE